MSKFEFSSYSFSYDMPATYLNESYTTMEGLMSRSGKKISTFFFNLNPAYLVSIKPEDSLKGSNLLKSHQTDARYNSESVNSKY